MTIAEEVKVPDLEKAEIPWVVAYLREDIQDLRNEVRENRRSIQRLDARIDARTDELRREMNVQFRWMVVTMVTVGGLIVATLKLLP